MFALTGITGKVGGEVARTLLEAGQPVRAVLRDAAKASAWEARGCEIALAEMEDATALTAAFSGTRGVFILPPSDFDPAPGYPEAQRVIDAVTAALAAARPARIVCLSTIGADAPHDNLLSQRTLMEQALGTLGLPLTILRPAWFMENAAWDVASARDSGVLHSYLQPVEKAFPMVATRDVGRTAARLLQEPWDGIHTPQGWVRTRIVELEGPARVTPNDLAAAFSQELGKPVQTQVVPRDTWEDLFRAEGMKHPEPRMRMVDGFNQGWIEFLDGGAHATIGETPLQAVVASLVKASGRPA